MRLTILMLIRLAFIVAFLFSGCSSNGLEGQVAFVAGEQIGPASGINVKASCETNIREEKGKAIKTTKTDASGHFVISNLLPGKDYYVSVDDPRYVSSKTWVKVPEKGTISVHDLIKICPNPPGEGIWVYEDISNHNPTKIDLDSLKVVTADEWTSNADNLRFIPENLYQNEKFIAATAGSDGAIVLIGEKYARSSFGMGKLYKIDSRPECKVQGGWYNCISQFNSECQPKRENEGINTNPNLAGGFYCNDGQVYPTGGLSSGIYLMSGGYVIRIGSH